MKNIREKIHNDREKVKTFFHITKNPIKQISSIYGLKKINKGKQKNLFYFEVYSVPGTEKEKLKINQDTYLMIPNVNNTHNAKIFGVFDGHGVNSDKLSQEIRDYFIEYFSDNNIYNQKNILFNNNLDSMNKISNDNKLQKIYNLLTKNNYSELNKIFEKINNKLHDRYKENDFCLKSGSTSNIVIVMNDKKKDCLNKIISINLGDSKSLLINEDDQAIDLNIVHNPEEANERERIEKNGGEISRVDWADYGPLRVYYKEKHYPGLAMTRTFGDFNAESLGINTIPDIREYDFADKKPKIIIIATDGIWQFLSNEKVKDIVLPYYEEDNISGASQKLVSSALRMWETKNPEFIDDITVIILFFK
jgi:serine/threonine protein phosphatase PrpC